MMKQNPKPGPDTDSEERVWWVDLDPYYEPDAEVVDIDRVYLLDRLSSRQTLQLQQDFRELPGCYDDMTGHWFGAEEADDQREGEFLCGSWREAEGGHFCPFGLRIVGQLPREVWERWHMEFVRLVRNHDLPVRLAAVSTVPPFAQVREAAVLRPILRWFYRIGQGLLVLSAISIAAAGSFFGAVGLTGAGVHNMYAIFLAVLPVVIGLSTVVALGGMALLDRLVFGSTSGPQDRVRR